MAETLETKTSSVDAPAANRALDILNGWAKAGNLIARGPLSLDVAVKLWNGETAAQIVDFLHKAGHKVSLGTLNGFKKKFSEILSVSDRQILIDHHIKREIQKLEEEEVKLVNSSKLSKLEFELLSLDQVDKRIHVIQKYYKNYSGDNETVLTRYFEMRKKYYADYLEEKIKSGEDTVKDNILKTVLTLVGKHFFRYKEELEKFGKAIDELQEQNKL